MSTAWIHRWGDPVSNSLVDPDQPWFSAIDPALTLGVGVFETLAADARGTFAKRLHLQRLSHGARRLRLPDPDPSIVNVGLHAVQAAASRRDGLLRVRVTHTEHTLVVTAHPYQPHPAARVVTSTFTVPIGTATSGVKSLSYADAAVALAVAQAAGADEALRYTSRGYLSEACYAIVFIVTGDEVATPPLRDGPLPGITRHLIMRWADDLGLTARERSVTADDVESANEVWLTSSLRGVQPVQYVDGRDVTDHPVGDRVAEQFNTLRAAIRDPSPQ